MAGPQLGPQLGRYKTAQEVSWRADLTSAQLNVLALAWQGKGSARFESATPHHKLNSDRGSWGLSGVARAGNVAIDVARRPAQMRTALVSNRPPPNLLGSIRQSE